MRGENLQGLGLNKLNERFPNTSLSASNGCVHRMIRDGERKIHTEDRGEQREGELDKTDKMDEESAAKVRHRQSQPNQPSPWSFT
jgi:hypothetical protein